MNKKSAHTQHSLFAVIIALGLGLWIGGFSYWTGYEIIKMFIIILLVIIGAIGACLVKGCK